MELILLGLLSLTLIFYCVGDEGRIFLETLALGTWLYGRVGDAYRRNSKNTVTVNKRGFCGVARRLHLLDRNVVYVSIGCIILLSIMMGDQSPMWVVSATGFIIGVLGYGPSYYDGSEFNGKRAWPWLRTARGWRLLSRFFQHSVRAVSVINDRCYIESVQMQPNDTNGVPRRLYACRPHGIWSLYVFLNFMVIGDGISGGCGSGYKPKHHFDEEKMNTKDGKLQQRNGPKPNKKQKKSRTTDGAVLFFVGVHSLLLAIPIVREFMLWMGAIDVSWQAIVYQLTRTDAICHVAIIPEGVRGIGKPLAAATSHPHAVALLPSWHAKQWGFLHRLFHMELDVDIIPVICPTETSLCHIWTGEWSWISRMRAWTTNHRFIRYPFPTFFAGPWPQPSYITWHGPVFNRQTRESLNSFCTRYQKLEECLWKGWTDQCLPNRAN
jgi:hypothetical protein